jgi:hypothetical protein
MQYLGRQLFRVRIYWGSKLGSHLQGGKTCAASPARSTLPTANLLHRLAEKAKGLDRSTLMQSDGNWISESDILVIVRQLLVTMQKDFYLPVFGPWVSQVWHQNLHRFRIARHEHWVLPFLHHELEPPQSVRSWSKSATYSWTLSIANKPEVWWEEEVINLVRGVSQLPEGEIWMGFSGWRSELQVHSNPGLVVPKPVSLLVTSS